MIEISNNIQVFSDVIGAQEVDASVQYRLIKYAFVKKTIDGVLIFNNLTKGIVYLTTKEYDNLFNIKMLASLWYLVPQNFNDKKFCNQVRELNRFLHKKNVGINSYTIFTTTDCNARCFYCYEKNISKINMPHKVAEDLAYYIIKHSCGEKVEIMWFGGEPLYNLDAIDTICEILKQNNIEFFSKMISNSYLFDDSILQKATQLWNLKWLQVTLDGTEKIYNRTKSYIYNDSNAFERVFENIGKVLDVGITINIRLNLTSLNASDLNILVDKIYKKYGTDKKIIIYVNTLYNSTGLKKDELNPKALFALKIALQNKIYSYGYNSLKRTQKSLKINACMSDNDSSITVLPMGQLGKCEHYSEGDYCGSIYKEDLNLDIINKFKERSPEYPKCDDCLLYPDCFRLKVCGEKADCVEDLRLNKINRIYTLMENTYNFYKNNNTNIVSDEFEVQC